MILCYILSMSIYCLYYLRSAAHNSTHIFLQGEKLTSRQPFVQQTGNQDLGQSVPDWFSNTKASYRTRLPSHKHH